MPIFEYKCKSCGNVVEVLQAGSEKQEQACPKCGKGPMDKIFSSFGVDKGHSSPAPSCPSGGSCGGGACPYN
jgi:putative FmdB family regulatory protein